MARRFDVGETLVEQSEDPARGWYHVRWAGDGRECCSRSLFTPAWLVWPFLPTGRRTAVLQFAGRPVEWVKALAAID
jgi:hypothetical protein